MKRTGRHAPAIAAAMLLLPLSPAWSSPTSSASGPEAPAPVLEVEGDPAYGEYLASECLTCHRADGSVDGIPSIIGWPQADFVTVMRAYKNRSRKNPVMQLVAGKFSDEELAALAAYFEGLDARR